MKNLILTALSTSFFLIICNCNAQKVYRFDKVVNNTFSTKFFPDQKWINLFNSEDDTYHMQIYNRNDSLVSRIFDTKENKVHYFHIDKSDSLRLKFMATKSSQKFIRDYKFKLSEIKKRKDSKEITFKIFNNRNKRIARYKFKIKETEKNLFSIFRLSALEIRLFTDIITSTNFLVLEAKGTNTNGAYVEYKLDSIQDINLNVEIPE